MKSTLIKMQILGLLIALPVPAEDVGLHQDSTQPTRAGMISPPLKSGTKLDPDSDYAKHWPGMPVWHKLGDNLILRVPPQFGQFWLEHRVPNHMVHSMTKPAHIPEIPAFNFRMFLPDFEGYTPDNYQNEFNEDEVQIISIKPAPMSYAELGAPGSYPPNQFQRASNSYLDVTKYDDKYGLRCYEDRSPSSTHRQNCYGLRDAKLNEYMFLNIYVPPYANWIKYPIMQTTYFTKQYGGLEITWRAHMKHFNRWHDIDHQIWLYIDTWNIANTNPAR